MTRELPAIVCALLKPPERRVCSTCGEGRPLSSFRVNRRKCRHCESAYMKAWHAKRREGGA